MTKTITHSQDNTKSFFGDEDHLEAAQKRSFSQMIFELLCGQNPTPEQASLFDLILNLSIDHGPETPSATKVVEAAREGKNISESVASGVTMISDSHGGAIEPCMEFLYRMKEQGQSVSQEVEKSLAEGKKMAGFGHRIYEVDPRAQLILTKLKEAGLAQDFIDIALETEKELREQKGKVLPINIDGAIACVLCSWGWEANLGKAVFIIARTPGLCGQFLLVAAKY